jgi:hypothetical protein
MIRIAISPAAFEAVADTLPLGFRPRQAVAVGNANGMTIDA